MQPEARNLHQQAEQAREDGDFLKALELTDQAMVAYQEIGDKIGFAEIQASRFLTLRHLYEKTNDKSYLILAKHTAQSAVELAEESGSKEALAIPYFNLAKVQEALEELPQAVESYKKALENMISNPPPQHNRLAVVADFKIHLATTEYKAGDKEALEKAENALAELEQAEETSDYNKHVWVSGGHMRIAEMLMQDNPEKARGHLQKAKEVIDADPRLKLRLSQWQKLADKFN